MVKLFDDEQDQQLAPKPIDLSQDLRSTVEARTISEDTEDVGDIAAGLLRAYQGQAAETGGPPQITDVDQLTQSATDIERAIERLPGEEDALGLARTGFSIGKFFVDNIVGVANTLRVGIDRVTDVNQQTDFLGESLLTKKQTLYDSKKYEDHYDRLRKKEGRSIAGATFSTIKKVFDESPELKNEGEFVKGVVDRLAGQVGTITAREADEITGYWRPEASTTEQVVRAIPEFIGVTAAGVKFFSRGSKKIIKEFEDNLGKSVLKASEDEIRDTTLKMMDDAVFPIANALKLGGIRKTMYGRRVAANLRLKQMPTRFREANKKIEAARNKVSAARTKGDKDLLAREEAALRLARSERVNTIPKELIEIPITEAGAITGSIIAGNVFGEEYGALFGALGGGLFSVVGFSKLYDVASGSAKGVGSLMAGLGNSIGALSDDQVRELAQKGVITGLSDLPKRDQQALKDFGFFIRSLPVEARENVYKQLKFFGEVRNDLVDAGVDPEVLETTMGKATGLIPLMMMKNTISTYKLDLSKGIGKIDKELEILLKNEDQINQQLREFRGLLDNLAGAADQAGVQNDKFNAFVAVMRNAAAEQTDAISRDKSQVDGFVQELLDKISNPAIVQNVEDKEALDNVIESILNSRYLDKDVYGTDPGLAGLRQPETGGIATLQEAGTEVLRQTERTVEEVETDLVKFLNSFLDPAQYQTNAEAAGDALAAYARHRRADILAKSSKRFSDLDNAGVEVDITDWLRGLYGDDAYTNVIPYTGSSKLLQKLGNRRLSNSSTLEGFSNVEGKVTAQKALEENTGLKDVIQGAMDETEFAYDVEKGITYFDVRAFFQQEYAGVGERLSDFDVFMIMREIAEVEDLPELSIKVGMNDIQKLSSGFSEASRKLYGTQRANASRMAELAESVVETVDESGFPELSGRLREAKEYWLNNVVRRYRDRSKNALGFKVDNPATSEAPVKWIDMKRIMSGDSQFGADIIDQIKKTFGGYYSDTGEYVLSSKGKKIVKNIMNDLLARHINDLKTVRGAREAVADVAGEAPLGDLSKISQGRALEKAQGITGSKLSSAALDALEREGLIDKDRVIQYNLAVDNFFGGTNLLKKTQKDVEAAANRAATSVKNDFNLRENFLKEVLRNTPTQEGARDVRNYDRFLQFFITDPQGQQRFNALLPQIAKSMNKTEEEAKKLFSDLTVESLSRATYADVREGGAGEYIRDFDHQAFLNFVKDPAISNNIKAIVGAENFKSIDRMADAMSIFNRDLTAKLRDSGIQIQTPRGLSVESLLSRAYSISRGVISPKYVATEVALLSMRKKKAQAMSRILSDPKMVDAVIDIIETEGEEARKYSKDIFTVMVNAIGYHENMKRKEKTSEEIRQLELDKFRR
jgi:hypothetical protein